jgi:hypothetical protein
MILKLARVPRHLSLSVRYILCIFGGAPTLATCFLPEPVQPNDFATESLRELDTGSMSVSSSVVDIEGFRYAFGGSKVLCCPLRPQSQSFPRNEISTRGDIVRVSQLTVWYGACSLTGCLIVPRNVREIVEGRDCSHRYRPFWEGLRLAFTGLGITHFGFADC